MRSWFCTFLWLAVLSAAAFAQTPAPAELPSPTSPPPASPPPAQRPRPADQAALFRLLASTEGLEASYREEKHLALLAAPLESSGTLYFLRVAPPATPPATPPAAPPAAADGAPVLPGGYLTRVVAKPEPATLRITPHELRLEGKDGSEVIDLQRSDMLRTFVAALVQVFSGDEPALRKAFTIRYEPQPDHERRWQLALVPRGKPLDRLLQRLVLHGEGEAITRIEWLEAGGDRTVTQILTADPQRRFTAAERRRWFGLEAR